MLAVQLHDPYRPQTKTKISLHVQLIVHKTMRMTKNFLKLTIKSFEIDLK